MAKAAAVAVRRRRRWWSVRSVDELIGDGIILSEFCSRIIFNETRCSTMMT